MFSGDCRRVRGGYTPAAGSGVPLRACAGGVPQERRGRTGESTRPGQESLRKFWLFDFRDLEDVARLVQLAGRGEQCRAGQGGGRLPPRSHSVALAEPMGMTGNELPPGTWGIQASVCAV